MIDILLSTYNGEKYVEELLESLNNQTYKDFNVIVRDDGSTDRTWISLRSIEIQIPYLYISLMIVWVIWALLFRSKL